MLNRDFTVPDEVKQLLVVCDEPRGPSLFSGDFGDRYFGTDGVDGWSSEDREEPSC